MPADPAPAAPTLSIFDLLAALRMIVAQLRLYKKESPQVVKVAVSVSQGMKGWLSENGDLVLAVATEGLLVNGKRVLGRDGPSAALEAQTLALLQEGRVRSIRFPSGFSDEEFLTFLSALAQKFWELPHGKEINQRLRQEGVTRITVDEVEYLEVGKDDILLRDGASKAEAAGLTPEELINNLETKLEAAAEGGKSPEMRLRLMRRLLEQDPSLLRQIQAERSAAGLLRDVVGSLTFEQAMTIAGRLKGVLSKCTPEAEEAIKQAAASILEAFRPHRALAPTMKVELEKTAPEFLPEWMSAGPADASDEPAAVQRTKVILGLLPAMRMEALKREGSALMEELLGLGRTDLFDKVMGQLVSALEETSAPRRQLASDSLLAMGDVLEADAFAKTREGLEARVRELLDQEKDPRVYSRLSELAASLADSRLKKGEVNQALRLLDVLKRHSVIKDSAFPERARLVLPALDRVTAGEGYKSVAGVLNQNNDAATRLQQAIDRAAIQFLVTQMKEIESLAERLRVGESITKVGETAGAILCEEIHKTTVPTEALRLLEVLPSLVPVFQAEDTLAKLLGSHPVLSVRRRAATLMAEKGYPRADDLLTFAFTTEKVPANRAMLAEALGRLGDRGLEFLYATAESKEETDEVRAACLIALGRTGNAKALPLLTELAAKGPKGFTRIFKASSPTVRAAAVKALGGFLSDENIRGLLAGLENDSDPAVKTAARQVLHPEIFPVTRRAMAPPPPPKAEETGLLAGMLDSMPLDQLLQMFSSAGKTGLLRVSAQGNNGDIYFESGRITSVAYQGVEDQAAFNALIALKQGAFCFRVNERAPNPRPPFPIEKFMLEAARADDERRQTA